MTSVSVAMATCNGERYIREQLETIARQTRTPDEIIIHDDASEDTTVQQIERFATESSIPIRLQQNKARLNYAQNFSNALIQCRSDVVFLSDQDDRWDNNKIEIMLREFRSAPKIDVLACDARITDSELHSTGRTKLEQLRTSGMTDKAFFMGCCMALKRTFIQKIFPLPNEFPEHDLWIATISRALGRFRLIEQALQDYRIHETNQSNHPANVTHSLTRIGLVRHRIGKSKPSELAASLDRRKHKNSALIEWITRQKPSDHRPEDLSGLERLGEDLHSCNKAINQRLAILSRSRLSRLGPAYRFARTGGYHHFTGWKSALRDLIAP